MWQGRVSMDSRSVTDWSTNRIKRLDKDQAFESSLRNWIWAASNIL